MRRSLVPEYFYYYIFKKWIANGEKWTSIIINQSIMWISRVQCAKPSLRHSLQFSQCKKRMQTGDEGVGVAGQRGCMFDLVQAPISPWECWIKLPHIYSHRVNTTLHTRAGWYTQTGTVSQHLQAVCWVFFLMDIFRHIACTQTRN